MTGRIAAGLLVMTWCLLVPGISARGEDADGPAGSAAKQEQALEKRVEELEKANAAYAEEQQRLIRRLEDLEQTQTAPENTATPEQAATPEQERLRQRVEELETAQVAHEDATREIIRATFVEWGSKINEFVDFGGVIEVLPGWEEDFLGDDQPFI